MKTRIEAACKLIVSMLLDPYARRAAIITRREFDDVYDVAFSHDGPFFFAKALRMTFTLMRGNYGH